jgi:hypothetical protein
MIELVTIFLTILFLAESKNDSWKWIFLFTSMNFKFTENGNKFLELTLFIDLAIILIFIMTYLITKGQLVVIIR